MISFIVPTIGRRSLKATINSIETWPGDEILLVSAVQNLHMQDFVVNRLDVRCLYCPPGKDWGHSERNFAMPHARGRYLATIDDDDRYAPGTRALMADTIAQNPDRPAIFKMEFPGGITLWRHKVIECGNIGTPMIFVPNQPEKLGQWGSEYAGDYCFLRSSKWAAEDYVWRPEVIALLGHDPGEPTYDFLLNTDPRVRVEVI